MEDLKIYISLDEAEHLVFNRILVLPSNRLEVKRAQGLMSVSISVFNEMLIENEASSVILFSAVRNFEIPAKEETLFVNHFKVPSGLLVLNDRDVRDVGKEKTLFDDDITSPVQYLKLRNGLLGIYNRAYKESSIGDFKSAALMAFQEINKSSEFKSQFISALTSESTFPKLAVKTNDFVTDNYFRVVWWAKYIMDTYSGSLSEKPEELDALKKWLKVFLHFNDLDLVNQQISEAPKILEAEINFLLGYFFAGAFFESLIAEERYFETLFKKINIERKIEIFIWVSFFVSFFDQKMTQLYFVQSYQQDEYTLERLAYHLSFKTEGEMNKEPLNIEMPDVKRSQLIVEYLELKEGGNHNPVLIKEEEAKSIFENYFSKSQINTIGLEFESEFERNDRIVNSCWFNKVKFNLTIGRNIDPSGIIFYTNPKSIASEKLKQLKFKIKPVSKLIEKKKVLLSFVRSDITPSLLAVYNSILKAEIESKFDKIVYILMVNLEVNQTQSLEFNNFLKTREADLKRLFDVQTDLVVKNEKLENNLEIKRNLKNILKGYKINQIEVVDENFDNMIASWIIESNSEYFIDDEGRNYGFILKTD